MTPLAGLLCCCPISGVGSVVRVSFVFGPYVIHTLVSFYFIFFQSPRRGKESWLLNFKCILLSRDCYRSAFLPCGAVDWSGPEVIKLEFILKLKIKRNDWLRVPQAANHCALF